MTIIEIIWALVLASVCVLLVRRAIDAYETRTGILARGDEQRVKVHVEHELGTLTRLALEGFKGVAPAPRQARRRARPEHRGQECDRRLQAQALAPCPSY